MTADYVDRVYLIGAWDWFTLEERVDAQQAVEPDPCLDAEAPGAPSKYIITCRAGSGKSTLGTLPPTYEYQVAPAGRERRIRSSLPGDHSRCYRSTNPDD